MQKLKTPRAAEPNRPGCLKYGATVFCAIGAVTYIFMALYDSSSTELRYPLLFCGALMVLFIWLMWRKPKAKRTSASSSFSPLEGKVSCNIYASVCSSTATVTTALSATASN